LQVYIRNSGGTETLVRDEFSNDFTDVVPTLQEWLATPTSGGILATSDRIVAKISARRVGGPTNVTVTLYGEGSAHASQIQTTISTSASTPISATPPLSISGGNISIDLSAYAPLASPALTGNPTAPTPTAGDNDTSIATTAFVTSAVTAGGGTDEVLEFANLAAFPATGTAGLVYVAQDTNKIYRWSASGGTTYATWDASTVTSVTLSGGNLVATNTGTTSADQGAKVAAANGKASGKHYFEMIWTTDAGGGNTGFGVGTTASTYTAMGGNATTGDMLFRSGTVYSNGSVAGGYFATRTSGQTMGVAVDLDNRKIWFRNTPSGNWNGTINAGAGGDPVAGTFGVTIPAGTIVPFLTFGGTSGVANNILTANFGATAFLGAVPSGFTAGWLASSGGYVELSPSTVLISDTAPVGAAANSLWWESDTGITYVRYADANSSQWVAIASGAAPQAPRKNYIINGAMMVSQENGSTAGTFANYYPVDCFCLFYANAGTQTVQQVTSTTPAGSPNRIRVTVTVADAAVAAGDYCFVYQSIEGFRSHDLRYGSALAKTVTLQFGVKAPAGTYCVAFYNNNASRTYVAEYVIAGGEANTEVVKTITLTLDTGGTWQTGNATGLTVQWTLMAGTTYQTAANAWTGTGTPYATSSQFNFMGTNGNVFELFDVSLTEGSVAPPFVVPDYASELQLCKRYWQCSNAAAPKGAAVGMVQGGSLTTTNAILGSWKFDTMRAVPTGTFWNNGVQNQWRNTLTGTPVATGATGVSGLSTTMFHTISVGAALTTNSSYDFDYQLSARL
jgi:hypothetical protein